MTPPDLWSIVRGVGHSPAGQDVQRIAAEIRERASHAALQYASFNLALRYLRVFERYLPTTIRATIHAKPGQLGVPSLGKVFPWNGIPVATADEPQVSELHVVALSEAGRMHGPLVRKTLPGSSSPFLYTVGRMTQV